MFTGPLPPIGRYPYLLELPSTHETCSMPYPPYHVTTTNYFDPPTSCCATPAELFLSLPLIIFCLASLPCYVSFTPLCLELRNSVSHSACRPTTFPLSRLCVFLFRSAMNYTIFSWATHEKRHVTTWQFFHKTLDTSNNQQLHSVHLLIFR